jgi:hypothetical protein
MKKLLNIWVNERKGMRSKISYQQIAEISALPLKNLFPLNLVEKPEH